MKYILKNEEGFTLMETLISLLISSFVIILLTGGLLQVISIRDSIARNAQASNRTNHITGDRQVEWHIFLNQLENYLQGSYDPEITGNNILVKEPLKSDVGFQSVYYRIDTSSINFSRRETNGYHRMLTDISKLHFTREGGWLNADVVFLNDDIFSGRIWIDSWSEKMEDQEEDLEKKEDENDINEDEIENNNEENS